MKHLVLTLVAAATLCTPAVAQNKVKNIYASTNTLNVEILAQTDQTVQLNRHLFAGYNTLCLPMSVSADQLKDLRIERMVAIAQEGDVLNLYFLDCTNEGIEAGLPYLVYSPTSQYLRVKNTDAMTVSNELKMVRMSDNAGNTVAFSSNWESVMKNGRYGIPAQQDVTPLQSILIRTEADKAFLPTRCGFNWEQQAATATKLEIKHIKSMAEMGTTGINSPSTGNALVDVYDLKGNVVKRQVSVGEAMNNLSRGIYVIGGEKVTIQ